MPVIDKLSDRRPSALSATSTVKNTRSGRKSYLFEDIIADGRALPCADTVSDEVAFWLYTSGSTGDPKGVKHIHSNLMATAKLFGQGAVLGGKLTSSIWRPPLLFRYGARQCHDLPAGRWRYGRPGPTGHHPKAYSKTMRRHQPTIFYGVPSLYTAPPIALCKKAPVQPAGICIGMKAAHIGERWRDVVGVDVLDGLAQPNCCKHS